MRLLLGNVKHKKMQAGCLTASIGNVQRNVDKINVILVVLIAISTKTTVQLRLILNSIKWEGLSLSYIIMQRS